MNNYKKFYPYIAIGLLSLILVTELLSKFDLITKESIQLFWIIFFIFLIIYFLLNYKNQFFFKLNIIHKILFQEKLIIIPIIIITPPMVGVPDFFTI